MKIRTKLILVMSTMTMLPMALLSYGIVAAENHYKSRNMESSAKVIEDSAVRVAMDAILQKDELQLVSYVNFLKTLYPALAYAKINWRDKNRAQDVMLGTVPDNDHIEETPLTVMDPADTGRRVQIELGIDKQILDQETREAEWELEKIILGGWLIFTALGMIIIFFVSGKPARRIKTLSTLAQEIGSGKLGSRIETASRDELGDLGRALNAMSDRLAELDEAKKNFVSSVTHELRSPLGAIEGFLSLIESKIKDGSPQSLRESYEYLARIKSNTGRLGKFIGELLDAAKFDKGQIVCVLNPMDFAKAAQETCELFQAKAQNQGVFLDDKISGPLEVSGDFDRLKQVLSNLISNALKFTPSGGRISISSERFRNDSSRWAEISVSDTGSGIAAKDSADLFTPFTQGKNAAQSSEKGTGLGLYIVKSIIAQHGGKIDFKSEPGRGTTVSFTLRTSA